ncbi:MAG: helix-hairpin-helix domain-containing protein [Candidatus Zixiibacteriota bacterium]
MSNCDRTMVAEFDYSRLSHQFRVLARPAQRALVNNGIFTPEDLAGKTIDEISRLHGIGASALSTMKNILRRNRLQFRI